MHILKRIMIKNGKGITLALFNIDELKAHEEIVLENAKRLFQQVSYDKVLYNPIIVSKKDYIILDGAHRVWVIRKMGYKKIIGMLVNYDDKSILVDRWYRRISVPMLRYDIFFKMFSENFSLRKIDSINLDKIYDGEKAFISIFGKLFYIDENREKYEIVLRLREIERNIMYRYGGRISYVDNFSLDKKYVYIIPPRFLKEDIRKIVKESRILPPKSTRHLIPYRIMNLNMPILYFNGSSTGINDVLEGNNFLVYDDLKKIFVY